MDNIKFFNEKGYVNLDNIFSNSECDEIIEIANDNKPIENYIPIMNIHTSSERILKFMSNSLIIDFVEEFFSGTACGLQTEYFFMPSGTKGFSPHQDNTYVKASQDSFISAWVALTDVTSKNGGLIVWPESHREEKLETIDNKSIPSKNQDPNARKASTIIPKKYNPITPYISKGSVLMIHSWLVHASNDNCSSNNRNSILCTYIKEGADFRAGSYAKRKSFNLLRHQ